MNLQTRISEIFKPDGPLATHSGFEHRPQQEEMALAIADALVSRDHLIVEAPTGIGKSLAYLIPALLYAAQENQKAIVATHTKNLQEQLWLKDVPLAEEVVGKQLSVVSHQSSVVSHQSSVVSYQSSVVSHPAIQRAGRQSSVSPPALSRVVGHQSTAAGRQPSSIGAGLSVAILKGRRNYLCTTRLRNALRQPKLIFEGDRSALLAQIAEWAETTSSGDLETLPFPVPPDVASRICSEHGICSSKNCGSDCFFQNAKRLAREADLVIVNHALFFTLLAARPTEDYFLFPNDFVIFDEAHLLEQSASLGIGRSLTRNQVLFAIHRLFNPRTRKGLLSRQRSGDVKQKCADAEEAVQALFNAIIAASRRVQPKATAVWWKSPLPVTDLVSPHLQRLQELLSDLSEKKTVRIPTEELASAKRLLWEAEAFIGEFLSHRNEALTYWVELPTGSGTNVSLQTAPTSVAESVGPLLFRDGIPVILTSATLGVGGDLSYYQRRVGAVDARALTLGSPFNFRKQMRIVVAGDMPQPDDPRYEVALPHWILRSIKRTHGRSLVLFTNAGLMRRMADQLRMPLQDEGISLLVQQTGTSRHNLLEEFKADVDSVLFGLDSFWMGVDVPGEALQHVIITRLPFAVPDHPLIQARMQELETRGEQPFFSYSLPEAVLKLRQGIGRLIRRSDDTGIVTLLDSRIVGKSYGKIFLQSLPKCGIEILRDDGTVEEVWDEN